MNLPSLSGNWIQVIVCYAQARTCREVTLMLAEGSLVQDALSQAREHLGFGMLVDEAVTVGIFGVKCDLCARLSDGDRVELYRALVVEPKVARRRRAAHRQKVRQTKNRVPIADRTV